MMTSKLTKKRKRSFGFGEAGFSLVEILITLGIGTTTTLLLTTSLVNTIEMGRSNQTRHAIFMKVAELQNYLRNPHVIQQIIDRNNLAPCTPAEGGENGPPSCGWSPIPISITDGGSAVSGGEEKVIYDATDPETGLTSLGRVCSSFVSEPSECPVRVNLAAQLECAGPSCLTMLLKVRGDLKTSPNYLFRHNFTGMTFSAFGTVEASSPPTELEAMNSMNMVLMNDGTVKIWGLISDGDQWADGSGSAIYRQPTALKWHDTGAPVDGVIDITGGSTHFCGVYQVSGQGRAFCMGRNGEGQLGNGTVNTAEDPEYAYHAVPVNLPGDFNVLRAESGPSGISGAIGLKDGYTKLYMWGNGLDGRLANLSSPAVDACMNDDEACHEPTPVEATLVNDLVTANNLTLRHVAIGSEAACAVFDGASYSGAVFCWGDDKYGQMGRGEAGTSGTFWEPTIDPSGLVQLEDGSVLQQVKMIATTNTTFCALLETGRVACWGRNLDGQMGIGETGQRVRAVYMEGAPGVPIENVVHIKGNSKLNCILLGTGEARCVGEPYGVSSSFNTAHGRTGTGAYFYANDQDNELLSLPRDLASVTVSKSMGCVLTLTSNVYCWGSNHTYALTDTYSSSHSSPVPVPIDGL